MTPEQLRKEIENMNSIMERLGMRVLTTYQCIYCGQIIDDPIQACEHVAECKHKEWKKKNKKSLSSL